MHPCLKKRSDQVSMDVAGGAEWILDRDGSYSACSAASTARSTSPASANLRVTSVRALARTESILIVRASVKASSICAGRLVP